MPIFRLAARVARLCVLALVLAPVPALAATFVVNSTGDAPDAVPGDGVCAASGTGECTLRAAVMEANARAGADTIQLAAATYTFTVAGAGEDGAASGDLDVTDSLTILGVGPIRTIIDGAALDRLIDHRGGTLAIERLTLRNGTADEGGALRSLVTGLALADVIVRNNRATGNGGGLRLGQAAQIVRTAVALNTAGLQGGGIYAELGASGGVVAMFDTTISSNSALVSGGGLATTGPSGSGVTLTHATVHINGAPAGSSLTVGSAATALLRNSIVSAAAANCSGTGTVSDGGGNVANGACGPLPASPALEGTIEPLGLYHPPFLPGPGLGHGLRAGSPAVGAALTAFCTAIDQRGVTRPQGGTCDSGALEYDPNAGPYVPSAGTLRLTPVTDQVIRANSSTNTFRVFATTTGATPLAPLELSAQSSNLAVVPSGGIRITRVANGEWSVRIVPAADRTGLSVVTLSAVSFATDESATTRFLVTVRGADGEAGGGTPTAAGGAGPANLVATPSGSGVVLTWTASPVSGLRHYVISGGRAAGGTSLPTLLTVGTETIYTIAALPAGTYAFRVHAIGAFGLTDVSNEVLVTAGAADAPGPPVGVRAIAGGALVEVTGSGPVFGAAPTSYQVDFGTTPGGSDVASVVPTVAPFQQALAAGFYWVQARARRSIFTGLPSSSFGVLVGPASTSCLEEPHAPVLLPASVTGGTITLTWVRPVTGPVPGTYRVERMSGVNGVVLETTDLTTQSTVHVTDRAAGTYYFRVAASNSCGVGALSNIATATVGGTP